MEERISWKRISLCGGRNKFMLTMFIAHNNSTCDLDQVQSPMSIFLRCRISLFYNASVFSSGQNIFSGVWNKVQQMWLCLCAFPWDRPKRSYKNTSTYGTGLVFRRCRFRSRVRSAKARCSSGVLVLTTASACLLGLCGLVLWLNHRYEFDSYMTI